MTSKCKTLIMVTLVLTVSGLVVLTALVFFMPYIMQYFIDKGSMPRDIVTAMLILFYSCSPFGYAALGILTAFLTRFIKGKVFDRTGATLLGLLSASLFAAAVICTIGGFYVPVFFAAAAAALMSGLISAVFMNLTVYKLNETDTNADAACDSDVAPTVPTEDDAEAEKVPTSNPIGESK